MLHATNPRIWLALIATLMFFPLGCGNKKAPSQTPLKSETNDQLAAARRPKPLKDIVVGFSQTGAESSWRVAHSGSVKQEAEEAAALLDTHLY